MNISTSVAIQGFGRLACVLLLAFLPVSAQSLARSAEQETPSELGARIQSLTESLERTQSDLAQSRSEIQQLRVLLESLLQKVGDQKPAVQSRQPSEEESKTANASDSSHSFALDEDDWQVLNARVEEHEQVKVESGSKYRLRLSGLALFNAFDTVGRTDNLDLPSVALPRQPDESVGGIGASLRQSIVGLSGIGPFVFGANASADLQMDFIGGATRYGGVGSGVASLRIARIRFDWKNTSLIAGLETPFFSPNSPSSFVSLVVPAFSSAGNLWEWTPAIRVEQRFNLRASQFNVQAGVLDPAGYSNTAGDTRLSTPGESSRQPTYSVRISANNRSDDRPASVGISGIYVPLRFPAGTNLAGWGGVADWKFPLPLRIELSGALFDGKGLDGFGGVALPDIQPQEQQHFNYVSAPALARIPMFGGWSQLKFRVNARSEFNLGAGIGARNRTQLRQSSLLDPLLSIVPASNQLVFMNFIFRPRSNLVFSTEYRRLRTDGISGPPATAGQIGVATGFLF